MLPRGLILKSGLLHIFLKHTSARLTINENADSTVCCDFETVMNRLVSESLQYAHDLEDANDMPVHVKSSLTNPITKSRLNIGTGQGIYLCEFRNRGGSRQLVLSVWS